MRNARGRGGWHPDAPMITSKRTLDPNPSAVKRISSALTRKRRAADSRAARRARVHLTRAHQG